MIKGLIHPGITVSHLESALSFFRDVFGIEDIRSQVSDQPYLSAVTGLEGAVLKIGFVRFPDGSFPLEVIEYIHPKGKKLSGGEGIPGTPYIAFETDNLDAFAAAATSSGVHLLHSDNISVSAEKEAWRKAVFSGPDGIHMKVLGKSKAKKGSGKICRIHHLGLTVSDMADAVGLLCDKLGLVLDTLVSEKYLYPPTMNKVGKGELDGEISIRILTIPGADAFVKLISHACPSGLPADATHNNPGSMHLCFQVENIFQEHTDLEKSGVTFVGTPALVTAGINKGAYAVYFEGFDGFRFEIFQKPQ